MEMTLAQMCKSNVLYCYPPEFMNYDYLWMQTMMGLPTYITKNMKSFKCLLCQGYKHSYMQYKS